MGGTSVTVFCLLAVSIASVHAVTVRPCDITDLQCIRYTFAALLGYNPVEGNGRDYNEDFLPLNVSFPLLNATVTIPRCLYSGFSAAVIEDFYFQDDDWTVLSVFIPSVVIDADLIITLYSPNEAPIVINSFAKAAFNNATATISYPRVSNLDVTEARPFIYLGQLPSPEIPDVIKTIALNPSLITKFSDLFGQFGVTIEEALVDFAVRIPWQYAVSNLVSSDDYTTQDPDAVATAS